VYLLEPLLALLLGCALGEAGCLHPAADMLILVHRGTRCICNLRGALCVLLQLVTAKGSTPAVTFLPNSQLQNVDWSMQHVCCYDHLLQVLAAGQHCNCYVHAT
jgi:hypothetical protein